MRHLVKLNRSEPAKTNPPAIIGHLYMLREHMDETNVYLCVGVGGDERLYNISTGTIRSQRSAFGETVGFVDLGPCVINIKSSEGKADGC